MTHIPPLLSLTSWLDPEKLLTAMGPWAFWGMLLIIFAECGLFAILPGDSLLFVAGLFMATGWDAAPNLVVTIAVLAVVAWLGNVNGYFIGYVVGPPLFKPDARVFKSAYAERAHVFFERFGARAIILARFVPIVRTFITLFAGVARMDRRQYLHLLRHRRGRLGHHRDPGRLLARPVHLDQEQRRPDRPRPGGAVPGADGLALALGAPRQEGRLTPQSPSSALPNANR